MLRRPRVPASQVLDRVLVLEMVRVTEAAAVAASKWIGRGDKTAADAAAVEAMREALNELPFDGTVVIGEGERDEAPMLYIGEKVGRRRARAPRSTSRSIRSKARPSPPRPGPMRSAVLAIAEEGGLLNAPDIYMDKLAVGPGYPDGIDRPCRRAPTDNIQARSRPPRASSPTRSSSACSTGRATQDIIAELRALGLRRQADLATATSRASSP